MYRTVIIFLCAVVFSLTTGAPAAGAACHEDESCWRWPTMGNQARGIVSMRGTPLVVKACRFRRMMERRTHAERVIMGWGQSADGQNDSAILAGDRWALRNGCE